MIAGILVTVRMVWIILRDMQVSGGKLARKGSITGKVSDPESLSFYVGFDTPGWLTPGWKVALLGGSMLPSDDLCLSM